MAPTGLNLDSLPVELLYDIFAFARSDVLPHTCKHLYAVFKTAPTSVQAQYLLSKYYQLLSSKRAKQGIITYILRYPICTESVLETIFRNPEFSQLDILSSSRSSCTELPGRLFRNLAPKTKTEVGKKRRRPGQWSSDDDPLPFLRYLYHHPRIPPLDINSNQGYALTKAVGAGFTPLVRFLLKHGADPSMKGCLAVMVAIRRKDLALVKMLIEPGGETGGDESEERRGKGGVKRRRLEDRVQVNQKMLASAMQWDAKDIANYFVKDKGLTPPMQSLMTL